MPDMVYLVAHHHQPVQAEAEGEARVSLRVDAAGLEDLRVNHSAATKLHPLRKQTVVIRLLVATLSSGLWKTNIDLETGFDEGEITWSQSNVDGAAQYGA